MSIMCYGNIFCTLFNNSVILKYRNNVYSPNRLRLIATLLKQNNNLNKHFNVYYFIYLTVTQRALINTFHKQL